LLLLQLWLTFVRVPEGDYWVGERDHPRNPLRKVHLRAYEIGATEVTNAQFAEFIRATGYVTDAEHNGFGMTFEEGMDDWDWVPTKGATWRHPFGPAKPGIEGHEADPVTQISSTDAQAYCAWAGGRLPSVEEWEVAARSGQKRQEHPEKGETPRYPWGDEWQSGKANNWQGNHHKNEMQDPYLYLAPVGQFPPNQWGLYDVIGNVFEYCTDSSESKRAVARGGSWWCSSGTCNYYNLIDIGRMHLHGSLPNQGFRMARSLNP
jgi:sulfatase modifying factor 1